MVHISPHSATYEHQQSIGAFALAGEAAVGVTVAGGFSCVGWCTYGAQNYPKQPLTLSTDVEGERAFGTTATAVGAVGNITTRLKVVFGKPGFTNSEYVVSGPQVRCDNAVPGITSPGCVFPQFVPTIDYSLTGPYPQLAAHIKKKQDFGLPTVLNRLRDPANKKKNNSRACPDRYPRPEGHDCDEYPFQSTEQGAYTGNPDPDKEPAAWPARTFDGCRINEPNLTGSNGYSVCMIDSLQNQEGGGKLNTVLYIPERVIGGDAFNVEILP